MNGGTRSAMNQTRFLSDRFPVHSVMRPGRPRDTPSLTWRTFLRRHTHDIWAYDFLQLYDASFNPIYAFFIVIQHPPFASRCTRHRQTCSRLTASGSSHGIQYPQPSACVKIPQRPEEGVPNPFAASISFETVTSSPKAQKNTAASSENVPRYFSAYVT